MKSIITIQNLEKTYGVGAATAQALKGITFGVETGEFVAIMGPSGSGKTTLLNILAGLDLATGGEVLIASHGLNDMNTEELADFRRSKLGFVFQDYNLLDSLTLAENIALPLLLAKKSFTERVQAVMGLLGIEDLSDRLPYQVSGGQQQRAAVARALVHDPSLVLADEPSGNLDSQAAANLLDTFASLNQTQKTTIVMVTHDSYAASYASRVVFLKDGRLFHEICRNSMTKNTFYDEILAITRRLDGVG